MPPPSISRTASWLLLPLLGVVVLVPLGPRDLDGLLLMLAGLGIALLARGIIG